MRQYLVNAVTRRKVQLLDEVGTKIDAVLRGTSNEVVCGDKVSAITEGSTVVINEIIKRKNLLLRSYQEKTKLLASNLDLLLIVAAVSPLFNTVFIDRTLAACEFEGIKPLIVLNKADLGTDETEQYVEIYRNLEIPIIYSSAKLEDGITSLRDAVLTPDNEIIAFCGISGVGKSSLINRLIPGAIQKTSGVSQKTGQGRQTTTMAQGYLHSGEGHKTLLIDLPGLQHFGISHIPRQTLRECFVEFEKVQDRCQFQDCSHINEPKCAVKESINAGLISTSRYNSYLHMREEIERGKPY